MVAVHRWIERVLGRCFDGHLCVTQALQEWLSAEWGIKYNDECLKFEKEWKIISDKIEAEQRVYLEKELSELQ